MGILFNVNLELNHSPNSITIFFIGQFLGHIIWNWVGLQFLVQSIFFLLW